MSANYQVNEYTDYFLIKHIKMIGELFDGEKFLNEKILNNKIKLKKETFVLFDKDWLDKWKDFVGYELIKEKCIKVKRDEDIKNLLNEVRKFFIKLKTKQNLETLGNMDGSKLKNNSKKGALCINEESDFIPILANNCAYFMKYINGPITTSSEISNGVIYIHEPIQIKKREQKLIIFYKEDEEDKYLKKAIITLEPVIKMKDIIKDLTQKEIDEILYLSPY